MVEPHKARAVVQPPRCAKVTAALHRLRIASQEEKATIYRRNRRDQTAGLDFELAGTRPTVTATSLLLATVFAGAFQHSWSPVASARSSAPLDETTRLRTPGSISCFPTKLRFNAAPKPLPTIVENAATPQTGLGLTPWMARTCQPLYEVGVAHRKVIKARRKCAADACFGA